MHKRLTLGSTTETPIAGNNEDGGICGPVAIVVLQICMSKVCTPRKQLMEDALLQFFVFVAYVQHEKGRAEQCNTILLPHSDYDNWIFLNNSTLELSHSMYGGLE